MLPLASLAASAGLAVGQALAGAAGSALQGANADKAKIQKTPRTSNRCSWSRASTCSTARRAPTARSARTAPAAGVYRSMLNKEYAQSIVQSGGIGIGDQVMREMLRMQGGANV